MEKEIEKEPEEEGGAVAPADEPAAPRPEPKASLGEDERDEETDEDDERDDDEEEGARAGRAARDSGDGDDDRPRRRGRFRRRVCAMCESKVSFVDYKDFGFLRRFISDRGRIESRRKSGTCAKHQRALAQAIKRARHLALLPYSPEHIRISGVQVGR